MLNELGPNDWRFKAIKNAYESGNAKKVGAVVCQNPNAHWNQIEAVLLDADYSDMVQFADELNLEQNNEDKMLNEVKRLQQLAGLITESSEPGFDYLMDLVDDIVDPQSPEHQQLQDAINDALMSGEIDTERLSVEPQYASEAIEQIAQQAGINLDGEHSEDEEEKDYFEYLDETPIEVQEIVEKYADDMNLGYEECQQLVDELEQVGWTCDYGLDGIPYHLQPISKESELNEALSPLDFNLYDEVWIQKLNTYGTVVDTEVENEDHVETDLIVVELPNKKRVTVSTSEVEKMEDNGESDGEHYGDDEDDASYYARRGWQSAMEEEEGKVIPFKPKKEKGVRVQDFEDDNDGNLDDYISKLVAQQMNKGKQIQFNPKK